jgi:hypothetical protein
MLPRTSLAAARLSFVLACRTHHLSLADLLALLERSPTLRVLFTREPELEPSTIARLMTVTNLQQWREPHITASSAFDLLEQDKLGRFESWHDLILDANHHDIVLCGRGVHFEGLFLTERPVIHRGSGSEGNVIVINGHHRRANVAAATVARLHAFCEFCFGTLAIKNERICAQPASPESQDRLAAESIHCPRCGERTVL